MESFEIENIIGTAPGFQRIETYSYNNLIDAQYKVFKGIDILKLLPARLTKPKVLNTSQQTFSTCGLRESVGVSMKPKLETQLIHETEVLLME